MSDEKKISDEKKVSRRKFLTYGAAGVVVVGVAAAGAYYAMTPTAPSTTTSTAATTAATTAAPTTAPVTPVTLTAILQTGGMGIPGRWMMDTFNAMPERAQDGIHIEGVSLPWESIYEKWMLEANAKSTTYAIEMVNEDWLGAMARFVEDLTPFVEEHHTDLSQFPPGILNTGKYQGKWMGFPWRAGDESLLVYRKDLFEKYGIDPPDKSIKTIDDYINVARKLNHPPDNYGCSELFPGGLDATDYDFDRWLWALGGRNLNDDQTDVADYDKNAPLAIKIIEGWKTLYKEKLYAPGVRQGDDLGLYCQGKIGMYMDFSARALVMEDPAQSKVVGKTGWALFCKDSPDAIGTRADYIGPWLIGINPNLTQEMKEKVYKYIEYVISYDAQFGAATAHANNPVRLDVINNPTYYNKVPSAAAAAEGLNYPLDMVCAQRRMINTIISDEVDAAILGKKTTEAAVKDMWDRTHASFSA